VHILTGNTGSRKIIALLQRYGWGRMWIDERPRLYAGERWGFDNGAFGWWVSGQTFNETLFLRRLERAYSVGVPYLAVVPDIVAGGERSLEFSLGWLDRLPRDWPWYIAVQDGMTLQQIAPILQPFAGIFLGGTVAWKGTAWYWADLAHRKKKLFHYGRAGTPRKLFHALESGADSADSAGPLWTVEKMAEFVAAAMQGDRQVKFFGAQESATCPGIWIP